MRLRCCALLGGVLVCGSAWAGPNVWTTTGPHGGEVYALAVDANDPAHLHGAGRGSLFASFDAGVSWTRREVGLGAQPFLVGLQAPVGDQAYAIDSIRQLAFRTDDDGATWSALPLGVAAGDFLMDLSTPTGSASKLAIASAEGVYVSTDGGATFSGPGQVGLPARDPVADRFGGYRHVHYDGAALYVATAFPLSTGPADTYLYRSTDDGASFVPTTAIPFITQAVAITVMPGTSHVYVLSHQSIAYSPNSGGSWNQLTLPSECLVSAAAGPTAIAHDGTAAGTIWLGCNAGLFRTTDFGATWTPRNAGRSVNGTGDPSAVDAIVFHPAFPATPRLWTGARTAGIHRSDDAGASFVRADSGFESTNIRALAAHPSGSFFAGFGDAFAPSEALYRSDDDGLSWPARNTALNAEQIRAIAIDPNQSSTLGTTHVYAVGRSEAIPTSTDIDGGIYKSTNGGASWTSIDSGIGLLPGVGRPSMGTVRSVAIDARSCPGFPACSGPSQTIYVGGSGRAVGGSYSAADAAARIYKSTNAGATWTASESGLPAPIPHPGVQPEAAFVVPLVVDPTNSNVLYAGTALSFNETAVPTPTITNGVFKSVDGGATWTHSSNGLPRYAGPGSSHLAVLALAIVPTNPNILYASASRFTAGMFEGRVYKSTDAGANWFDVSGSITGDDVRALLVDASDPSGNTVYAGSAGVSGVDPGGVYKTTDGGVTWNSISVGLPADAATALMLDPADPTRLFAGTVAGVWEMTQVPDPDADAVPTATEASASSNGIPADADGDGVANATDRDTAALRSASGVRGGAPPFVAIDLVEAAGCTQVNNASAVDVASLPPDPSGGFQPYGQVRFELPLCTEAVVMVRYAASMPLFEDWTWRNYGPTVPGDARSFGWYRFENALRVDDRTFKLTLAANAQGNWRSDDDTILFQGGPSFGAETLFSDGFED